MKKEAGILFRIIIFIAAIGLVIAACNGDANITDIDRMPVVTFDSRVILSAGIAVTALAGNTAATVTFTGATGQSLSRADFTTAGNAAVSGVSVSGDTAAVTISFAVNITNNEVIYTVGISSSSTLIKGSGAVTVTQGRASQDTRRELAVAAAGVDVAATANEATIQFTGATGLALTAADFAVSGGVVIKSVNVSGATAAVTISFDANTSITAEKIYVVSVDPNNSNLIKGNVKVTVTQAYAEDTRTTLTAAGALNVAYNVENVDVTFTGATGLTLTTADFTVSSGARISAVSVSANTATVTINFNANNDYYSTKTFEAGISHASTVIRGGAIVPITQAARPDGRKTLIAGPAVTATATEEKAVVTFTGASGLTLTVADFAISGGAGIEKVNVTGDTAAVAITFDANTAGTKTYMVGIRTSSGAIKGEAIVIVTQTGGHTHDFTGGWTADAVYHWINCPDDSSRARQAFHEFLTGSSCEVCGLVPFTLPLTYKVVSIGGVDKLVGIFEDGKEAEAVKLEGDVVIDDSKNALGVSTGVKVLHTNSSGYAALGQSAGLALRTEDSWAIEVIVFLDSSMASGGNVSPQIFGISTSETGSAAGSSMIAAMANGQNRFSIRPNGWGSPGGYNVGNANLYTSQYPSTQGQWRHFVFSFGDSTSRKMDVYMDGVLAASFITDADGKKWLSTKTMALMPIAYLGRPVNWGLPSADNSRHTSNSQYYSFAIYPGYRDGAILFDTVKQALLDELNGN
jgi:hypothetical protein